MKCFIVLIGFCCFATAKANDVENAMKALQVIPDVISKAPQDFLKVSYENNVIADKGAELTPTQVKNPPKIEWKGDKDSYYTLIMTDPDAPSREAPSLREWQHWLVVNIPGNNLSKGETLSDYIGSAPPKGTGLHRYILLVFKQPSQLKFDEPKRSSTSAKGREKFSTKKFIEKYNLIVSPVAGNFFQAQYDSYVPKAHEKLVD